MRISIATRLAALGLLGTTAVALVGTTAYRASADQKATAALMAQYSTSLSEQWNADMLHDGIRGTVMASLVARTTQERSRYATDDIGDEANEMLAKLDAATSIAPPSLQQAYREVRPRVVTYGDTAKRIVATAVTDPAAARAQLPGFISLFDQLEKELGAIDEALVTTVNDTKQVAAASAERAQLTILVTLVLAVVTFLAFSGWTARYIVLAIRAICERLAQVAAGDLTVRVPERAQDELGDLARSVNITLASVQEAFAVVRSCSDDVLTAVSGLSVASGELTLAAAQTSERASESVALAGHVSDSAQEVARGIDVVSDQAGEIAGSAGSATSVGQRAVDGAQLASLSISRLGESSAQISGVAAMIRSIADQTRLLALNATIEAARAGEAGRGFAVVANEVKDLAQEVGRATEDISTRISAIQSEVDDAVQSIAAVSDVIGEINAYQGDIAEAVQRQARSSSDVAASIQTAAGEAAGIVDSVQVIAAAAVQTAASAETTQSSAVELSDTAGRLKSILSGYRF